MGCIAVCINGIQYLYVHTLLSVFSCPDLKIISADHLVNTIQATVYHINDTIGFLCDKGYTLSGPKTLTCVVSDRQTEGQWNGTKPICKCKNLYHVFQTCIIDKYVCIFVSVDYEKKRMRFQNSK